jgi:hypothetical protein
MGMVTNPNRKLTALNSTQDLPKVRLNTLSNSDKNDEKNESKEESNKTTEPAGAGSKFKERIQKAFLKSK